MDLPNSVPAKRARSANDWRLRGVWVWAIRSQARAATTARSKGGKGGLTPSAGLVLEDEVPLSPALPPEAHRVGVQLQTLARLDIGEQGLLVEQQDQAGALAEVSGAVRRA